MLKRLTYISRSTHPQCPADIEALRVSCARQNRLKKISGFLMYVEGIFFQVIEGEERAIDGLFKRIRQDQRHNDVICLKCECPASARLFAEWEMNWIKLEDQAADILRPLHFLFEALARSNVILQRYTQPAILRFLARGLDPLEAPPEIEDRVILFADIAGFSRISEQYPLEAIRDLVNTFFEIATVHVAAAGGETNKFVGDNILAYFVPKDTDRALRGCLAILRDLERVRRSARVGDPRRLLSCGFGLDRGQVMIGNVGSAIKRDFTVIGDPVNSASRIEGLTRSLNRAVLFSEAVRTGALESWSWVALGPQQVKGKERAISLFSFEDPLVSPFFQPSFATGAS